MDLRVNYLLLATALLGTFFSGTATRIVAISMPTVAQSLGTDLLGVSWALLSYQLSNIGLSVIFGRISDLWGREKMFALGFLVFAVSSLLCGFSQTVLQLIVARFVQGVGGAMLQSSSRALASESVTEDLAGRAQGYMTTAHHTGFILGPSIGGLMIDYFSWRWSFFLLAPIGFGGMLLALMNMKRRQVAPQHYPGSVDYLGAALLFAVTTTLVFILDRRTHQLIGSSTKFFLLAVFIGSLAAFLVHESRAQSPFVNLELFKIRRFSFSVVSLLVVSICYALTSFLMPFYLQDVLHLIADAGRRAFYGAVDLDRCARAGERLHDRPAWTAHPRDCGRGFYDHLFGRRGDAADRLTLAAADSRDCRRRDYQRHLQPGQFHGDDQHDAEGAPRFRLGDESRDVRLRQRLGRGIGWAVHVACF